MDILTLSNLALFEKSLDTPGVTKTYRIYKQWRFLIFDLDFWTRFFSPVFMTQEQVEDRFARTIFLTFLNVFSFFKQVTRKNVVQYHLQNKNSLNYSFLKVIGKAPAVLDIPPGADVQRKSCLLCISQPSNGTGILGRCVLRRLEIILRPISQRCCQLCLASEEIT